MTFERQIKPFPCRDCNRLIYLDDNIRGKSGNRIPLDYGLEIPHDCITRKREIRENEKEIRTLIRRVERKTTEYLSDGGIRIVEEQEETPIIERRLNED